MRRIGRFVVACLATLGAVVVLILGLGIWAGSRLEKGESVSPLPHHMVLTLDLDRGFRQGPGSDPFALVTGTKPYQLPQVVAALDQAAGDPRVGAVFANLGSSPLGIAGVQELRDAVERFRASGKPAVIFSESLGESGNGTLAYYLASAFGQIWLQPSGEVALQGFATEAPYLKGLLDWIGVEPQFAGRWEYKSAIEMFTEKSMSAPHRENLGALLDTLNDQAVAGIAKSRKLAPETAAKLMGKGPFLAHEAVSAGLVDQLGYRDQAEDAVDALVEDADEIDIAAYGATHSNKGTDIAVITGVGEIHRGRKGGALDDSDGFSADVIAKAISDATDDDRVQAILFRVDSPGGSYTASDTVWREVVRARAGGKPVVVSMGDVAASGGYFVGMAADRVVAEPGTITGSIGVFTGKLVMKDLWAKLGVNWDGLSRGDNAAMWSANKSFTPAQWDRVNQLLDAIYKDFTAKAAEGRRIDPAQIDKLARGRVWSGADAQKLGLVDKLGGMEVAEGEIRQLLNLDPKAPLHHINFPQPKKPWEMIEDLLQDGATDEVALRHLLADVAVVEPFLADLGAVSGAQGHARLMAAPLK